MVRVARQLGEAPVDPRCEAADGRADLDGRRLEQVRRPRELDPDEMRFGRRSGMRSPRDRAYVYRPVHVPERDADVAFKIPSRTGPIVGVPGPRPTREPPMYRPPAAPLDPDRLDPDLLDPIPPARAGP